MLPVSFEYNILSLNNSILLVDIMAAKAEGEDVPEMVNKSSIASLSSQKKVSPEQKPKPAENLSPAQQEEIRKQKEQVYSNTILVVKIRIHAMPRQGFVSMYVY